MSVDKLKATTGAVPTAPPPPYDDVVVHQSALEGASDQSHSGAAQSDLKCIEGPSSGVVNTIGYSCCTSDAELLRSELEHTLKYPVKIPGFSSAFEEANLKLTGYYSHLRILEGKEPRILAFMKLVYESDYANDRRYDYVVLDLKNGERDIDIATRYMLKYEDCRFDGIIDEGHVRPFVSALTGFDNALANCRRDFGLLRNGLQRKGWIRFQYFYAWEFKVCPKQSVQTVSPSQTVNVLYLKNCFTGEGAFAAPGSSTLSKLNSDCYQKETSGGCVML